jgi:PEGA domain
MKLVRTLKAKSLICLVLQAVLGTACFAGSLTTDERTASSVSAKAVTIVSEPTAASVSINGAYVGKTPCVVNIAVNSDGQCTRPLDIRAQKYPVFTYQAERFFPGKEKDGANNLVPSVLLFDLNVQRVVTLR